MFLTKRKKKEKIIESLQLLGWLLETGLTMLDSIRVMHKFFKMLYTFHYYYAFRKFEKYWFLEELWFNIENYIVNGGTLSDCIRGYKLIDPNIVERIAQGEQNGNLPARLIQVDMDEFNEWEENNIFSFSEESSDSVLIVNKIIKNALNCKAEKVALPSLPDGEKPCESEPIDKEGIVEDDLPILQRDVEWESESEDNFTVYFQIEGKWHLYYKLPGIYRLQIINRILLMSALPYWTKSESEAVIKFHQYLKDRINIKVNYFPESQSVILTFQKVQS